MTQEIIEMAKEAGASTMISKDSVEKALTSTAKIEAFAKLVAAKKRNDTLEEVAQEFDKMKVFGDTAASFAIFVRGMKS